MPRISKVTDTFTKLEYGYLYDIQTLSELHDWFTIVRLPKGQEEFLDAYQSRESGNLAGRHATSGAALATFARIQDLSLVDALIKLNTSLTWGMETTLERAGRLFINAHGGYFGFKNSLQIEDTREVFAYQLPSQKIRIIRWPHGTHYYAKIGDQDVVVDGVQKWDTWDEALTAANRFIQEGRL